MTKRTSAGLAARTVADARIPRSLEELPDGIAVPKDAVCVFVSGSLIAGWGHAAGDVDCFYRISVGMAVIGADWLRRAQDRLAESALPLLLAAHEFGAGDSYVEDAIGLMEVGDRESPVLAARQAFGHAVDGYLAARGSLSPKEKGRYRKLAELPDSPLSPEEYWALETMRDLDPADTDAWVSRVIEVCNSLVMEVDFS